MRDTPWLSVADAASRFPTPFFLLWPEPFKHALEQLNFFLSASQAGNPKSRHWYSYKSQPVPRMAVEAKNLGLGCEVVSRFELTTALNLGFSNNQILINGVGKRHWLRDNFEGINVVFDSLNEVAHFAGSARRGGWRVGFRVAVAGQIDPDAPSYSAQFGIEKSQLQRAMDLLSRESVDPTILHFHLHSDVTSPTAYLDSIAELSEVARTIGLHPEIIDIGGGLSDRESTLGLRSTGFPAEQMRFVRDAVSREFTNVVELWLENGRHLLGPSGALVVTICDEKWIGGIRYLICDGGRTNQALESDWQFHPVLRLPNGEISDPVETVICGPTCMAFDWIHRGPFTRYAAVGDRLLYLGAGAYHISWETRFSTGLCRVIWTDDGRTFDEIRRAESPDEWRSIWRG